MRRPLFLNDFPPRILTRPLSTIARSCASLRFAIVLVYVVKGFHDVELNLLKVGVSQKIPGLLLQLSKKLPGYSEDRAIMNIGEFLESNGITTGDLYGQDNNVVAFISSIVKGNQKEMDENSFVQVSLDYAQIPVAPLGGVAVIPPGLLKAHGKLT